MPKESQPKHRTRIDVYRVVGEYGISGDDGKRLYDLIFPILNRGEGVDLDFSGVKVFASPFFNFSVGRLLGTFRPENLATLVNYRNLSAVGKTVLKRVLENAEQYYYRPEVRKALDEILHEANDESADK